MATLSGAQVAQKWKQRMAAAAPQVKAGVMAVQTSPMEKAASKAQEYAAGVARAVEDGTYQAGLRSVSLDEWKTATAGKGADRIAAGAAAAETKQAAFFDWLLPKTDAVKASCATMPRGTKEDSRARMNRAFDMMSQVKYKGRPRS